MADSLKQQLKELRDQVDSMVDAILGCSKEELNSTLEMDFEGKTFKTDLRSAVRYTIEEYRIHEGQIGGNQFVTEMVRADRSQEVINAVTPYDRKEAAWLAAELYVAAAGLIARCIGYPDNLIDEKPKEGEWSIREIVDHMLHMERSGEWSIAYFVNKARESLGR